MSVKAKKSIIYMATFPDGARYIGRSKRSLKERIKAHLYNAKVERGSCHKLYEAIRGTENKEDIKWEVLWSCPDKFAARAEHLHIREYDTLCSNNPKGLNMPSRWRKHAGMMYKPLQTTLVEWKTKMEEKWKRIEAMPHCPICEEPFHEAEIAMGLNTVYHKDECVHFTCLASLAYEGDEEAAKTLEEPH